MKHIHKEVSECKHEKLTYCKECDVVECECGREWVELIPTLKKIFPPATNGIYTTTKSTNYCTTCYGTGTIAAPCPDGKSGCLFYHSQPCPNCKK